MTPGVIDAALEGIDAWQGPTNAFAQVFADEARADAEDPAGTGPSPVCR